MPNSTYATALSITTHDDFSVDIADLIIGQNKILRWLAKLGFVNKKPGGANITKRLMYAENSTFGSISAYEAVDLTPQEPFTAAVFAWKLLAGATSLAKLVLMQNSGNKHQISSIWGDLMENSIRTAALELTRQFWSDGLGNGGKDFGGIDHLVAQNSWGTVGGINSTTDTWWRNQFNASVGSFAANGVDKLDDLRIACERNNTSPGICITEANGRAAYEKACLQLKRIIRRNDEAHDLGLPNVEYAGMPMVLDPNVTSGEMFLLSPDSLELRIGTSGEGYYKKSGVVSPVDQDVQTQLHVLYGNLATSDRSTQGVNYGITYP